MKLSVPLFIIFSVFLQINGSAQLPVVVNPELKLTLQKVLADFQYGFKDLKGDQVTSNPQTVVYETSLKSDLMEENSITEYSGSHPVYSWQATLLTTEDYQKATDKYKRTFKQLKQVSLHTSKDGSGFHLYGEYEEPSESSKFVSSVFDPVPATALPAKLKVELSMQFEFPEWKVKMAVYRKDHEDDEQ